MKRLILIFLVVIFCLSTLDGCKESQEISPVSGGIVDLTDPEAPKSVESREITGFSVDLCLYERRTSNDVNYFRFRIEANESGELVASELSTGISNTADDELIFSLRELIDEYSLAEKNGVYRVTSGLPPEYGEITFSADFASGEKLSFTVDNDPLAEWEVAVYDVFANWFSEKVEPVLLVEENTSEE